jgi:hypothetical protein
LILIIFCLIRNWLRARFWFIAGLLFFILSLGSYLDINGQTYLPLPYYLVQDFFVFRALRHPDRFNALLAIPVSILAANGAFSLLVHPKLKRSHSIALILIAAGLISFEYAVRYPLLSLNVPQWYKQLAQEEADFAILDLPMHNRVYDEHYMYYQTVHGKPIVGGHVSRPPREAFAFINSVPMLEGFPDDPAPPDDLVTIGQQLRLLDNENIRYIVLHKRPFGTDNLDRWQAWLGLDPLYEDNEIVVYGTSYAVGRDIPLIGLTPDGIGLISATLAPTATLQGGSISVAARWGSQATVNQDYDVCLAINDSAGKMRQTQCQQLSPAWSTGNWSAGEIVDDSYALSPNVFLPAGNYSVTLQLHSQGADQAIGRPLPVGQIVHDSRPRILPSSIEPAEETIAKWDDQIALLDFEPLSGNDLGLTLTFRWQAQRRMDGSYKFFVHLMDADSKEVISQVDAIPDNWSYPTDWWEQGEMVQDTVRLSLADVPPGEYALYVGWYQPETGERLPVYAGADQIVEENALLLTTIRHETRD